ncbi:family 43 glycosylhydrolase [Glycomyces niveus]|uniref:Family 43 glycosylhydrolase n=1 Tax=Glycomyces niveus TaxID=2820287 RepID=A0ABS3U2R2_9ACTN|nr:family 43 glycosylhydrolase [Glycomyces sp. NEAU-S30]MBO3733056.1 family 43 glycosylhydrolase [Glycomyces sp. NEAU-S30]
MVALTRASRPARRVLIAATAAAVALAGASPVQAAPEDHLVAHYALNETTGTVAADSSGHGRDAQIVGGATLTGGEGLRLDGADDHVKLPNNLIAGLASITVSTEVLVRAEQGTPYFIYGLGNPATSNSGTGYLFSTGNAYRTAITTGNWSGEQNTTSGANLARGVWKTITYTLDDATDTATLYLDGVQVAQKTGVTVTPAQIGGGTTTANYIGRSNYAADKHLAGSVRDFRVYDVALSASEVAALHPSDETKVQRDVAALSLGDLSNVTSDLALPTAGSNGSQTTWATSDAAVISSTGRVTRPASGTAQVTLTATATKGSSTATRDFTATVPATGEADLRADLDAITIPNADDIRGNITLPETGPVHGSAITWTASPTGVVSTAAEGEIAPGVVTRGATDQDVVLTATAGGLTREFPVTVRAAHEQEEYEGYAFAYFTGNSVAGENIHFAASEGNNALAWNELNGGLPVLSSQYGEQGLRDPFIIRSPEGDKFYLIATDLSIGSGTSWDTSQRQGSRYLEVWESHDLVNWSAQRHVLVSPETAGNTWAPEAYYDEGLGAYVVFWASKLYAANDPGHTGNTYNRMLYATTRDFVTFSEPQIWQDGKSRIDSTVTLHDGVYYRFTKDEGAGTTGCSDIIQESSTSLRAPLTEWTMIDSCIGRDAGTSAVEGPSIFQSNPGDVNGGGKHYLFVDEYGGRGYIPLTTDDIATGGWKVASDYDLPASPRHGTVIPVTAAELAGLYEGRAPISSNEDGEVVRYDFADGSGTTLTDVSGNGRHAKINGATWADGALTFDGTDDYVDLPDDLMGGLTDISVDADVWVDQNQSGSYFIWGLGNTDAAGAGRGYLFTTGNGSYRTSITAGAYTSEQTVSSGSALPRGRWAHLTYTLQGDTARLYLDGILVSTKDDVTIDPGDISGGETWANYLGRSLYEQDSRFKGKFKSFAVYDRALTPAEVLAAAGATGAVTDVSLGDPAALATAPLIDAEARTVVLPVVPGTDVSALRPTFTTAAGAVASPASGSTVDLSAPVEYTVTYGGQTTTWTFSAQVVNSPVLPGLYADPNIAVFGDTYYLYATTDGYPGWGGKDFYVWSSKDLVDWTRSEEPILTLDGANGDVPWASGNAWAPTIIERDGKYYFYFSGHNTALNRKTIGVAVADSPEGPFTAQPQAMILNNEAVTSGQAIDPAAFRDPVSGKYYLAWGNGGPSNGPVIAELNDDMVSVKAGTFKRISGLTDFREGVFLNYRDGLYHLTYSIDDTGSENYRVGYATATSLDGPWTYRGVILQKDTSLGIKGTGHSSIINVPGTDDWYIAYHRFALSGGDGTHRETTIDRLEIGADGLFQPVTPTLSSVPPQTVPEPGPAVAVTSGSRCAAGKVVLTVTVANHSGGPVSLVISTPYGNKTIASLAAGGSASTAFTTRAARIAAGEVTVTATDAANAASETTVAYAAANCG